MEIQHWSHEEHPLVLREDKILNNQLITCGVCGESHITAPFYACETCKYYVEKSCAELPYEINHSFHPKHPLTLTTQRSAATLCDSCLGHFNLFYTCLACNFDMDVECALIPNSIPPNLDSQQWIQHSSHPHNLLLFVDTDNINNESIEFKCLMCNKSESSSGGGGVYYGCSRCKYFLHKKCLDQFPEKINFPFHSHHGLLELRPIQEKSFKCQLCEKVERNTLAFECCKCDLRFCLKCGVTQFVKYEDHEHLLYFIEKMSTGPIDQCDGYETYCWLPIASSSTEFRSNPSLFKCLDCGFKVHLLCGPLPSTIEHEYHVDSLTLVDSLVEEDYEEYYCDVCETKRDPRFRVYHCKECKYTAHVHCVIPKVLNLLKGDHSDVELKTVGESQWMKLNNQVLLMSEEKDNAAQHKFALTLKDVINKLITRGDQSTLRNFYKWGDTLSSNKDEGQTKGGCGKSTEQSELGDEDIDKILQLSRFTNKNFEHFFSELHEYFWSTRKSSLKLELTSRDLAMKIIEVEGYMIPYTTGPVLRTLLDKYGNISSGCWKSKTFKSFVFFILCKVVKRMCNTMVIDITRDLLKEWYYHLQFVKWWDFKINFALAQFERLVCAFLGLQVNKLGDEIPSMLNNNIKKLQQEMAKIQEKIEEKKAKLEIIQKEYQGLSPKSEFMEKCLTEASKLKWKKAYEGLSPYPTRSPISKYCWF